MKKTSLRFKFSKIPNYFGILLPLMMLLKPQVKIHIKQECVRMTARTNHVLVQAMDKPCELIAESLSDCLIKEAEKSGKILPIVSDLISKKYGDASEDVTKKCIASTLGLPEKSLDQVPLAALVDAMQNHKGKVNDSDVKEAKKEQTEILEDAGEIQIEMPEEESNSEDNQVEGDDSDGENKYRDQQDPPKDTEESTYKKEMPKFKF